MLTPRLSTLIDAQDRGLPTMTDLATNESPVLTPSLSTTHGPCKPVSSYFRDYRRVFKST